MRNQWFPKRVADYVTVPEMKILRLKNVPTLRDFQYGVTIKLETANDNPYENATPHTLPIIRAPEVQKLTSERSMELIEIFVPPVLEFHRQPINEEKKLEKPTARATPSKQDRYVVASTAAADLLAARTMSVQEKQTPTEPQAIYGSVSAHDVLVAMRAAIADNDEAARVILTEDDVKFVDLPTSEETGGGKLKHVGDFVVEMKVRGAEKSVRRAVKISPQET